MLPMGTSMTCVCALHRCKHPDAATVAASGCFSIVHDAFLARCLHVKEIDGVMADEYMYVCIHVKEIGVPSAGRCIRHGRTVGVE